MEKITTNEKLLGETISKYYKANKYIIVLGSAEFMLSVISAIGSFVKKKDTIFLPLNTTHHSNYYFSFHGALNEIDFPIIFTQSKEFLETILNNDVIDGIFISGTKESDDYIQYQCLNFEEAYKAIFEDGIDLRDYKIKKGNGDNNE